MKKLSIQHFNKAGEYIENYGRSLEKQIYGNHFSDINSKDVLNELKKYQNKDGGFGNSLEADYRLPLSSPMATAVAFQHLVELEQNAETIEVVKAGIEYFEDAFIYKRRGWLSVPKEVNNFPHAPWWNFNENEGMTVIDEHWGNPSAEIIGYLYKYKKFVSKLDVDMLLNYAIEYFNDLNKFESEHEVYCYIRLYKLLPESISQKLKENLTLAIKQLISNNRKEWDKYVPQPLHFIDSAKDFKFRISDKLIEDNLDYLVESIELNGKVNPSWEWGTYKLEWEKSKNEWSGVLTLKALIMLEKFDRIEKF